MSSGELCFSIEMHGSIGVAMVRKDSMLGMPEDAKSHLVSNPTLPPPAMNLTNFRRPRFHLNEEEATMFSRCES